MEGNSLQVHTKKRNICGKKETSSTEKRKGPFGKKEGVTRGRNLLSTFSSFG